MKTRVSVDFNTLDWDTEGRVWINTIRDVELERTLCPGLAVILVDSDLEVDATVEFEEAEPIRKWLARPDWSTRRDIDMPRETSALKSGER
jgi:hypothetical protein